MRLRNIFENTGRIVKGVNTTVDVGPNEIKTQAAKFGNTVDKDGYPPTHKRKVKGSSTNVLFNLGISEDKEVEEKWSQKYKSSINCSNPKGFSQKAHCAGREKSEDQHPNERPLGPETKPTMPKGTIRVKVSDVYDWYKLGQHISDLKGLGKHDFGKGPPETVLSFGSEEEEHMYVKLLQKLGLDILDVDPGTADAPGVKTDPRYNTENIDEGEFRADDVEEYKPNNDALDNLKSKYLPDWEMLDHRILQAKYVADDHRAAVAFVKIINIISEKMDHFCEVTQDVAEVTVRTTTFDVKGLTLLDFQIAMIIDKFASDVGIKQVPMSGNFGMHEDAEPMDREFALVKKLGRLGQRIVQNPKLWDKYEEANDSDNTDWIISLIMEGTGATFNEVLHLSDVFSEIGGGLGRIIDFAWAVKEGHWEQDFLNPYRKYRSQDVAENFADGKKPGRKGLAKRSGVNCKQSVTKLRKIAKNSSGEKRRMAHWCANMKSGKD